MSRRELTGRLMAAIGILMFTALPAMYVWVGINGYENHPAAVGASTVIGLTAIAGIVVAAVGFSLWGTKRR